MNTKYLPALIRPLLASYSWLSILEPQTRRREPIGPVIFKYINTGLIVKRVTAMSGLLALGDIRQRGLQVLKCHRELHDHCIIDHCFHDRTKSFLHKVGIGDEKERVNDDPYHKSKTKNLRNHLCRNRELIPSK